MEAISEEWLMEIGGIKPNGYFPILFSDDENEIRIGVTSASLASWFLESQGCRLAIHVETKDDLRKYLVAHRIWPSCPSFVGQQYGEMLQMAFDRGDESGAIRVVQESFRVSDHLQSTYIHDDTYLATFLSERLVLAMESIGVFRVDDLAGVTTDDLYQMNNFGDVMVNRLIDECREHGITWPLDSRAS